MAPEDVLIESIQAAARYGDSPDLRTEQCAKLLNSIERYLKLLEGLRPYAPGPVIQGEA